MEKIIPSSELRNKYNEISSLCKESREPIYITVNGKGDTVLLSLEDYNKKMAELELLKTLAESEEDVIKGRVSELGNSLELLKEKLIL